MGTSKIKAGALQFTLFVTVIIALLLMSSILLIHTHKQFKLQSNIIIETAKNANRGIIYALHNNLNLGEFAPVDIANEDYKFLKVHREFWGIFDKITSYSQIKNKKYKKVALLGAWQPETNKTALYLKDNYMPLVLVGNTTIQGIAYLPSKGVKAGAISGESYHGTQLIYGESRKALEFPKINSKISKMLGSLQYKIDGIDTSQFLEANSGNIYKNSFLNPVQVLYSNDVINLKKVKLIGNIIVQSKKKIVVEASSILKDVVLIAPKIEIKQNFKGSLQAFASVSISVGKSSQLNFPTALVVNDLNKDIQGSKGKDFFSKNITIGNNAIIKGVLIYLGGNKNKKFKPQIVLNENAKLIGELYCNKNTELRGTVYGSVYSYNFIANKFGSIYQNHIFNGNIKTNNLPKQYLGLLFTNSKKEVLKWLY